jgi:lipoprotein signal peptidase
VRTGIFNVADIAIVVGVALLALPEKPPHAAPGEQEKKAGDAG